MAGRDLQITINYFKLAENNYQFNATFINSHLV